MEITKLSSKGQVVLPKSVRDAHLWQEGTSFAVEEVEGGVLLRPLKPFAPTKIEDLLGCLQYKGKAKSLDEMDQAIAKGVMARSARGRY